MKSVTCFQRKVYDRLREVPAGRVTTYRLLAEAVGCRSPRAVGQALKNNPFAPEVPCHRVIQSDLSVGGFFGCLTGVEVRRKRKMLRTEGVDFVDGRLKDESQVFVFGDKSV
ncbi:MAG: MGMT family protein [Kiritimatiellae bacterium]|nr:MGMT family protein [Kiritimatiellia bacterium]